MTTFLLPVTGHSPSLHVPWSLGLRVKWPSENYLKILYLFTRSDLKTILLPVVSPYSFHHLPVRSAHLRQTMFAFLASPSTTPDRMFYSIFWTWLHLLQFCVSNQSLDPEEDSSNKPWRPIPSGLISIDEARKLRWILLPFCLSISMRLEAYWQGISLALAILAHNEFGLHSHLFLRNVCNAWGYASFNAGALTIASGTFSDTGCAAPRLCLKPSLLAGNRPDHDIYTFRDFLRHQCAYYHYDHLRSGLPRRNRGQAHGKTDDRDSMAGRKSDQHLYGIDCLVRRSVLGV